jgi:MFS family permease
VLGASYGVTNLGLGIGSLIAGLVLVADPGGFAPLFAADAATYAIFAVWLIWTGEVRRGRRPDGDAHGRGGYRVVVRNRALLIATGLNLVLVTAGYSQFMAAFPAWATGDAGAPRSLVGFAFAANTWTIAVAQLPMLTVARSRRRTRLVAWTGLLFAVCWLVVLAAGETSTTWLAYALLLAAPAVFGLGETLLSPSLPAIVNDLATDETRGRFVAVYSMGWQIGPMIGPAAAGVALGAGQGAGFLVGLAAACVLVAPAAIAYERILPPAANRADITAGEGVSAPSTENALI